jgi:flavin-dependent dehydrogenase
MSEVDVCVIGGGPSGVITAITVARAGFTCILLDKKPIERIGEKNCGDALDDLHVKIIEKELNIPAPSIESDEARDTISRISLAAKSLDTKFTADAQGYQVNRLVYGQRLLDHAVTEGVEVKADCAVREIIIEDNFIRGVKYFDKQGNQQSLLAKITVDASGYIGALRKNLTDELKNNVDYSINNHHTIATYREIIKLNKSSDHPFREEIILLYHENIPIPGYAWIFTEGERMLNIGITWKKSIPYPKGKSMKTIFHDCLDPIIDPLDYQVIATGGGNIPMRPTFDSLVFNGGLLVGDAGALADPTTFEGHGPALESGRLAGNAIIDALQSKDYSYKALWSYNKNIMTYPGGMHAQSFLAAQLLSTIRVDGLHFLMKKQIISDRELREIFQEKSAKISLRSKVFKFIRAFPRWGMMLQVKKYIDLIEKAGNIYEEYPHQPSDLEKWRLRRNKKLHQNF